MKDPEMEATAEGFLEPYLGDLVPWLYTDSSLWSAVGFAGAITFGSRFLFQWLHSEKEKRLVVPWYFWWLSFMGSCINMLYFLHLDKAPLIFGNFFLPILYGRNLVLMYRSSERTLRGSGSDEKVKEDSEGGDEEKERQREAGR